MVKPIYRRIFSIIAIFIIAFTFLSIQSSASADSNNNIGFVSAPTSLDFFYSFTNPNATDVSDLEPNFFYSYQPILISDLYKPSADSVHYTQDSLSIVGAFPFKTTLFSMYTDSPDSLVGVHSFYLTGLSLSPTSSTENYQFKDFVIYARDFFCWNHNFNFANYDDIPLVGNEVNFIVGSEASDSTMFIDHIVVRYRTADSPSTNLKTIYSDEDSVYAQELASGIVNITPLTLGYTDIDTVIYIEELSVHFGDIPSSAFPSAFSSSSFDPFLDVYYTYNNHLSQYIDLGGSGGSDPEQPIDENPALALIPYTTWIGDAVSGFMDFELFQGFTLGGIFMTLLAFSMVIWFLKLVAGG